MLLVFLAYVFLILTLLLVERVRTRANGPDLFTCFLGLIAIQTVVPAAVIIGILALGADDIVIQRPFFEQVFEDLDGGTAARVLLMTGAFLLSLYGTQVGIYGGRSRLPASVADTCWYISMWSWFVVVAVGFVFSWILMTSLGGGIGAYVKLIQFRAGDPSIERTFVTANLYSLTQTFSLTAVVGVVVFLHRGSKAGTVFAIFAAVLFSLMTASRRALFVQMLLIYFVFVLQGRQLFVRKWLLPISVVALPIVMYGKQILGSIAFNAKVDLSDLGLGSLTRAVMDIGITTVESWATFMYLHEPFRFGVDHVLSVARRFPEGLLGLNIEFPERVVRISTEVFVGKNEADLPPGLFGQMWLDWGYFGPVVWGIGFGIQLGILQRIYDSMGKSYGMTALFVLLLFIVALPINTGSFDFTFSVDIIVLVVFMAMMVRTRSVSTNSTLARTAV